MNTEFRRAALPGELRALTAFDRRVFSKSDVFDAAYWRGCEAWWMSIDGRKVGCCAFRRHVDYDEEPAPGTLFIVTTGILPKYQGQGMGRLLKAWEIVWARREGFTRIVTTSRKSNAAMIALNRSFGFRAVKTIPRCYDGPAESGVAMELMVSAAGTGRARRR